MSCSKRIEVPKRIERSSILESSFSGCLRHLDTWLRLHHDQASHTNRNDNAHHCDDHDGLENSKYHGRRMIEPRTDCRLSSKPRNYRHENYSHNHSNHMILSSQSPTSSSLAPGIATTTRRGERSSSKYLPSLTTLLLAAIIVFYHHHQYQVAHCLDSPVKIQRSKQIVNNNGAPDQPNVRQNGLNFVTATNISAEATSSELDHPKNRENRVRRTYDQGASRTRSARPDLDCPPKRLIQSLLPPEYMGSPAMQAGGPRQPRGSCDCVADLSGWHLTCVAGDETSLLLMNPNANAMQSSRLPNQLHPAFRGSQLQRHKQQQRISEMPAALGPSRHRVNRSPTRWMGEDSPPGGNRTMLADISGESPSSSMGSAVAGDSSGSDVSIHEGFGEETNSAQTTSKPGSGSRTMSNNSSSNQAASADSDSFLSLPSSASFSMMMQGEHNNQNHSSEDKETARAAPASDNNEKLIDQNNHHSSNNNNNNNDHLMYETVPVLFTVKYTTTKNMIEIDCDRAAPNYKAAMFQGFNVNEVNSFTFNNCQLPNIPFSVLLHRTRPAATSSSSQTGAGGSAAFQALRPNSRPRQNQNLLVRRFAINDEQDEHVNNELASSASEALANSVRPQQQNNPPPGQVVASLLPAASDDEQASGSGRQRTGLANSEPKVRSLTVNLEGAVVDQRTLISLLTGLDQLEDLQLNYMQLNLTSFVEASASGSSTPRTTHNSGGVNFDLEADPSSSITTASAAEQSGSNVVPRPSPPSTEPAGGRTKPPSSDRRTTVTTPGGQQVATVAQNQSPSTSTSPSRASTTAAPTSSTIAASVTTTTTTSTTTTVAPTIQMQFASSNKTTDPMTNSPLNGPTAVTPSSNASSPAAPIRQAAPISTSQTRRQPVSLLKPVTATATRPSIPMGAPRGLIVAQVTGVPPPITSPTATTMSAAQTSTTSTTTPSPPTTTTAPSVAVVVPSVTLATVAQQVKPIRQQTNTISHRQQQMATTNAGNNIISVGPAVQSVSYTSQQQPAQTTTATRSQQTFSGANTQPATTNSLMSGNNIGQRLNSGWFASSLASAPEQPSAGSRLSGLNSLAAAESSHQATSPWTHPTAMTTTAASLGLSAPINTPGAHSFGIRTAGANNFIQPPTTTGGQLASASSQTGRVDVGLRTVTSSSRAQTNNNDNTVPQFVAAGGRLSAAANQARRRVQGGGSGSSSLTSPSAFVSMEPANHPFGSGSPLSAIGDMSDSLTNALTDDGEPIRATTNTRRYKRFVADSQLMEEFELSFGELLPNLRTLKLESFVDLSEPSSVTGSRQVKPPRSATVVRAGIGLSRPRRQFEPNDVPEHDELDAASDKGRLHDSEDVLIAEESNLHDAAPASTSVLSSTADEDHSASGESSSSQNENSSTDNPPPRAQQISLILNRLFSKLKHLKVLRLESNDIPLWPDNVLQDSRNSLLRLYLKSNNIRHLGRNSFANLTSLNVLDLSANQIRQLNGDLFRDLKSLHNIKVSRNLIRSLPSRLLLAPMKLNSRLQLDVDFSKNRYLSQLAADTFQPLAVNKQQHLASISSLNLSDCSFTDQLVAGSSKSPFEPLFASMPDVVSISLGGNKLGKLLNIAGLFAKNYRLQELDLSSNRLSALSGNLFNSNATHISRLQLSHNLISEIPDQFLFYLRGLRTLSLAHNRLSQLPANMFFQNQLIESIDLSHNQLIRLNNAHSGGAPFGHAANLRFLNFAHNNLSDFHSEVFQIEWQLYTNLRDLSLAHNHFRGQISMPIFNTVANEMSLDLGRNQIESIDMEDLTEHEKLIDQYVTESQPHSGSRNHETKVSSISVDLADNPIVCDCLLEPLITYAKRVEGATGPSRQLAANLDGMSSSSRYSVLGDSDLISSGGRQQHQASGGPEAMQPQLLYKFNLNGVSCSGPNNLRGQHLSQVSRADLLCPVRDEKLCPRQCECFFQSISRTAIVDCDNRQLTKIPDQLTNSTNFARVNVESSFSSPPESNSSRPFFKSFDNISRIIIRLNNNHLRSMEPLSRLFETIAGDPSLELANSEKSRFVRLASSSNGLSGSGDSLEELTAADIESARSSLIAAPQAQPLVAAVNSNNNNNNNIKKSIASPVIIGRNMHGIARQRSRRQTTTTAAAANHDDEPNLMNNLGPADSSTRVYGDAFNYDHETAEQPLLIEEGAGVVRKKLPISQPIYCELYLDNNLIDQIPESFLGMLDSIRSSSMRANPVLFQQAALPSSMQEPPNHAKIDHHLVGASDHELFSSGRSPVAEPLLSGAGSGGNFDTMASLRPLKPEQKEAVNENVRLNQQQAASSSSGQKQFFSLSPSLLVLSLKRNNLATISSNVLHRLSKLIHSSNTKLFLGHNPFNCSENFVAPLAGATDQTIDQSAPDSNGALDMQPLAPTDCPVGQLKTWLTRHHSSVGDLDELYCVSMPVELSDKLRLANSSSRSALVGERSIQYSSNKIAATNNHYDHLWPEEVTNNGSSSLITKNGLAWNSSLLATGARLIELSMYDLCPYSGPLIDPMASGLLSPVNQQILISVAIMFILISLCLLMMLVYFGDTQTILAFTYIHMNPIYKCLRLNESHLDGDKLYDAFVSYTDADRDIVMALVEKLEQQPDSNGKSRESLMVENLNQRPDGQRINNSSRNQETLNRSSSNITLNADHSQSSCYGGSAPEKLNGSTTQVGGNNNKPYRLCIHERDWLPGHLISWNIVNSVQNSRRTILILSKDFIKSTWFQVEFQTAYYQMIEDKIDRLIVIVRGELPPKQELDKNLAFLLTTKTYLKWGDKWFWERLHYALPHRVSPPAMTAKATARQRQMQVKHHHRYHEPAKQAAATANGWSSKSSSSDLLSPSNGPSNHQKPLIMSSIGKDCSNLLLPVHPDSAAPITNHSTSSSSSHSSNHTHRTFGASSFISGGTTTTAASNHNHTATTSNDLLSASPEKSSTTRLTIGPATTLTSSSNNNQSTALTDSGRVTATLSSSSSLLTSTPVSSSSSSGITNIVLDSRQQQQQQQQQQTSSSKARQKKQEKLHNFVEQTIADRFNLSEL